MALKSSVHRAGTAWFHTQRGKESHSCPWDHENTVCFSFTKREVPDCEGMGKEQQFIWEVVKAVFLLLIFFSG
jgi:hypothetical protein